MLRPTANEITHTTQIHAFFDQAGGAGNASDQYNRTLQKVYNANTCFWRCDEGLTKDDRLTLTGDVMAPLPLETVASTCPWSNGEAKAEARAYHEDGDTKNYAAAANAREVNRAHKRDRNTQPWADAHPRVWQPEAANVHKIDPGSPGANFYGKVCK